MTLSLKTHSIWVLTTLASLGLTQKAGAEAIDRGALEELVGEPITLSATGAPQRVTEAPVNMTIITREDIRRSGAIDLPGVLERLALVDVMRSSSSQADVSIRGYNTPYASRLLVLLNGRQVYLDEYGMTNWNAIPVELGEIRQIEVVAGPNTALFGFNAVAGVVNIVTYDALQDDIDQVSLRAGNPSYADASAIFTTRLSEDLGMRFSIGGFNAEALSDEESFAAAYALAPIDPEARRLALNAAYKMNEAWRADVEATWSQDEGIDRAGATAVPDSYTTNSLKVALAGDTALGLVQAQAYSSFAEHGALLNRISVAVLSLVVKPAPAHTLRITGELRRNALEQNGGDLVYDVEALAGMWSWQASPEVAVTSSVRADHLELSRSGSFPSPNLALTNADYDRSFTELSFNLGAVYRLNDHDAFRISAARGVGSPSLLEFGAVFDLPAAPGAEFFVLGDPSAEASIVHNVEFGWDHEAPVIGGRLRAALFWQKNEAQRSFASRFEVLSVFPTFVSALLPQVTGDSEMHGLDIDVEGQGGRLAWNGRYSWRHLEDTLSVPPGTLQAAYAETSPAHVFTAGATWMGEIVEFGGDLRYTSETRQYGAGVVLQGLFPVDAYLQANARVAWRLNEQIEVELSGKNLLDELTQTVGLNRVRRSFYLTLRATF